MDIEQILAVASRPEKTVELCVAGKLVGEFEQLEAELAAAPPHLSLADSGAEQIAARMEALREQMAAATFPFKLRALPPALFDAHVEARPKPNPDVAPADNDRADHMWTCALLAMCTYDPVMTPEQADRLSESLSTGQWRQLTNGAFEVNAEAVTVPFSLAASVVNRASASRSLPPEDSEPVAVSSLAGPDAVNEPPTDTTTLAA